MGLTAGGVTPTESDDPITGGNADDSTEPAIRVLHVLSEVRPSGAEVMLAAAASRWRVEGVLTQILAVSPRRGAFAGELEARGYVVGHLPDQPLRSLPIRFGRLLASLRPDVVHLHAERGNFWLAVAARLMRARVVRTVHAVFDFGGKLQLERRLQRKLLAAWGVVSVAVSPEVVTNEQRRFGNRCVLIENWIDSSRFRLRSPEDRRSARECLGVPAGAAVIATIGNCAPVKRHDFLLAALPEIVRRLDRPVRYLHLGEEGANGERRMAASFGLTTVAQFLGPGDPLPVLDAADVFVMPSEREGVGLACVEALAVGVPAVVTDVPGLRDLGVYDRLVRTVASDPAAITDAVVAALSNPVDPVDAADVSARVRQRFGVQRGVREHSACYRGPATTTPAHPGPAR